MLCQQMVLFLMAQCQRVWRHALPLLQLLRLPHALRVLLRRHHTQSLQDSDNMVVHTGRP